MKLNTILFSVFLTLCGCSGGVYLPIKKCAHNHTLEELGFKDQRKVVSDVIKAYWYGYEDDGKESLEELRERCKKVRKLFLKVKPYEFLL